jgi:hypothetical protein
VLSRPLGITLVCLLALAAACGSSTSTPGVITGTATPCVGATTLYAYRKIPVRVTLAKWSQVVAHQSGHGSMTYRFSEAPGQFQVSSDQSGTSPVSVAVHSGETTRVDLNAHCK